MTTFATVIVACAIAAPAAARAEAAEPVAVVAALSGSATVVSGNRRAPVRLFDWLLAGVTIEAGARSNVVVAFRSGARYELGENAKAKVAPGALTAVSGSVRSLESVPPFPRLAPIATDSDAESRSGAIRIRGGQRIRDLYPRQGWALLPDRSALSFGPVTGARSYKVEVEDESGKTVFEAETQAPPVIVSAGILMPGARYYWRVRTVEFLAPPSRGEAEFVTLSAEDTARRAALKEALEKAADGASLALLSEIDRRLGLVSEAREGLDAALARSPEDPALREALERLTRELTDPPER